MEGRLFLRLQGGAAVAWDVESLTSLDVGQGQQRTWLLADLPLISLQDGPAWGRLGFGTARWCQQGGRGQGGGGEAGDDLARRRLVQVWLSDFVRSGFGSHKCVQLEKDL